ncbi:hypothetical protein Sbal223_4523 (plasmid) [Shewanella baltica OS223]|uniref:hypothetical protein n=1 Tax=Shewanella baltica TaxID=62322 RepID=UPI0001883FC5|nr:hypothetical protein [Shewanella baltica]ACK48977.1 hypothetical protein Sbal223_4523 [Shewanella baltica OS223]
MTANLVLNIPANGETSGGCAALFRLSDNTPWCALKRASAANLFTLSVYWLLWRYVI